jgi:hypothetical protein
MLKCVDGAEPGLELVATELLDRPGEAFGDPPLPVCPGLLFVPVGGCLCLRDSYSGLLECCPSSAVSRACPNVK